MRVRLLPVPVPDQALGKEAGVGPEGSRASARTPLAAPAPSRHQLERTNLADLSPQLVPTRIDVVTANLSYVSLARAVTQLNGRVKVAPDADSVAVTEAQFEPRAGGAEVASHNGSWSKI